nr:hypothetical protein [uncultured Flavobacterium sp.]
MSKTEQKISKKEISEGLHTYGKVLWGGGSGKQFTFGFGWNQGKTGRGFKFLLFAYGKKVDVIKRIHLILNTFSDEEIEKLDFVQCDVKIPISCASGVGLNCL